jgi:hypothetical protein
MVPLSALVPGQAMALGLGASVPQAPVAQALALLVPRLPHAARARLAAWRPPNEGLPAALCQAGARRWMRIRALLPAPRQARAKQWMRIRALLPAPRRAGAKRWMQIQALLAAPRHAVAGARRWMRARRRAAARALRLAPGWPPAAGGPASSPSRRSPLPSAPLPQSTACAALRRPALPARWRVLVRGWSARCRSGARPVLFSVLREYRTSLFPHSLQAWIVLRARL